MALLSTLTIKRCLSAFVLLAAWPAETLAAESAAEYYVRDLPGVPKDSTPIKMHAGHIEITPEHNGNLFFWHFQNKHVADRERTIIWLNGGPGCSSEDGAMMEIGPYRVKDDNTLSLNEGSWHEYANLLFVDNPVGTGFSYVDTDSYLHELDAMASDFIKFLDKFFALFPQYEYNDLYIAGESYAGQYIPYIAKAILDRNKGKASSNAWQLKGLAIGNGWISPSEQYESYVPFALEKGLIKQDSSEHTKLLHDSDVCKEKQAANPGHVDYSDCERVLSHMMSLTNTGNGESCFNMYDVRLKDTYPSCGMNWPPDLKAVTSYLRRKETTRALHISAQKSTGWQECTGAVGSAFTTHKSSPAVELLPDLIKEVPILLFSGAEDLICNHIGTEKLIENLEWNGGKGFDTAPRRAWTFDGEDAGYWQEARNLTYVLFNEASHMVPVDYPLRALDMIDRFMGVDISHIHSKPGNSVIDGEAADEKGGEKEPAAPGDSSSTTAPTDEEKQKELDKAKWAAYQNSGAAVLVIVIVAVSVWGIFICRSRRRAAAYKPVNQDARVDGFRHRKHNDGDLEAAAFDESELDDLHADTPTAAEHNKYSVGDDSDEETEKEKVKGSSSR